MLFPPKSYDRYFTLHRRDDLSSDAERQAIGYLGVLLPLLLVAVAACRATEAEPSPLDSISQYYHSGAVAILTGMLAILAIFLVTYRGFDNPHGTFDVWAGRVAAVAALGVSVFPTEALTPFTAPPWWKGWMDHVHIGCATVLFASFAFYSIFLFPKGDVTRVDKRRRNVLYRLCGVGIVAAMIWAFVAHCSGKHIFWPETLALELFGLAWLAKGKALNTLTHLLTGG